MKRASLILLFGLAGTAAAEDDREHTVELAMWQRGCMTAVASILSTAEPDIKKTAAAATTYCVPLLAEFGSAYSEEFDDPHEEKVVSMWMDGCVRGAKSFNMSRGMGELAAYSDASNRCVAGLESNAPDKAFEMISENAAK